MTTATLPWEHAADYPVKLHFDPAPHEHNRLTTAFRLILAIPHLILVGGPFALMTSWSWGEGEHWNWGAAGGVLGAVAAVVALIAWFAILFTGKYPDGLYKLAAFYLRWRVRAVSYMALLRDEYPPFGDEHYPVWLELRDSAEPRDRLSVAFRILLAIPQIIAVWFLTIIWCVATFIAWLAILITKRYPESLYHFGQGALRWTIRVDAYLLLLQDEYPPFALE